jgi:hypothetical protein
MEVLEKHTKYEKYYKPNDIYYGIGIENETYLEIDHQNIQKITFLYNQKPERYSVNYYNLYKENVINNILKCYIDKSVDKSNSTIALPLLINAHSFLSTDMFGNHKTTYEKTPKPNRLFNGKTIFEVMQEESEILKSGKEDWYTFDGDSIEFMTQNFYNNKMENVINELRTNKQKWINEVNKVFQTVHSEPLLKKKISFVKKNYGFASFLTNRQNTAIFNNGTYHMNITLPTKLNEVGKIENMELFVKQHQNLVRLYQTISVFLIGKFGSGDIFNSLCESELIFPKGSQRLSASRYVSACTYDTDEMKTGKILLIPNKKNKYKYYDKMYDNKDFVYKRLDLIGVDINFNKHYNHGIEFRIFDCFDEEYLDEVMRFLIYCCDESLINSFENPIKNEIFNNLLANVLLCGQSYVLTNDEINFYNHLFKTNIFKEKMNIVMCYETLFEYLCDKYNYSKNTCSELMIQKPYERSNKSSAVHNTLKDLYKKEYIEIVEKTKENVIEHIAKIIKEKDTIEHIAKIIKEKDMIEHHIVNLSEIKPTIVKENNNEKMKDHIRQRTNWCTYLYNYVRSYFNNR